MSASEGILVKKLTNQDIMIYKALRLEALYCEPSVFISRVEDWLYLSNDEWRAKLTAPVFAALHDNEPIGMMSLTLSDLEKIRHRATIVGVYVREQFRRAGVASRLLQAVESFATISGIRQLELSVVSQNERAIRFYERAGFRKVGQIPSAFITQGHEVDEALMVRVLPR